MGDTQDGVIEDVKSQLNPEAIPFVPKEPDAADADGHIEDGSEELNGAVNQQALKEVVSDISENNMTTNGNDKLAENSNHINNGNNNHINNGNTGAAIDNGVKEEDGHTEVNGTIDNQVNNTSGDNMAIKYNDTLTENNNISNVNIDKSSLSETGEDKKDLEDTSSTHQPVEDKHQNKKDVESDDKIQEVASNIMNGSETINSNKSDNAESGNVKSVENQISGDHSVGGDISNGNTNVSDNKDDVSKNGHEVLTESSKENVKLPDELISDATMNNEEIAVNKKDDVNAASPNNLSTSDEKDQGNVVLETSITNDESGQKEKEIVINVPGVVQNTSNDDKTDGGANSSVRPYDKEVDINPSDSHIEEQETMLKNTSNETDENSNSQNALDLENLNKMIDSNLSENDTEKTESQSGETAVAESKTTVKEASPVPKDIELCASNKDDKSEEVKTNALESTVKGFESDSERNQEKTQELPSNESREEKETVTNKEHNKVSTKDETVSSTQQTESKSNEDQKENEESNLQNESSYIPQSTTNSDKIEKRNSEKTETLKESPSNVLVNEQSRDSYQATKEEIQDSLSFIKAKINSPVTVDDVNEEKLHNLELKKNDSDTEKNQITLSRDTSDYEPVNAKDPVYESIKNDTDVKDEKPQVEFITKDDMKPESFSLECIPPVRPTRSKKPEKIQVPEWQSPKQNLFSYLFGCLLPGKK